MEEAATTPDSGKISAQYDDIAPRFRRILAWIVDITLTITMAQLISGFIGYFAPLDTAGNMMMSLLIGLSIGFAYFGFATPVFGNTLGKWLFGIKIVDHNGQHTTVVRWFLRLLLVGLLPINGAMLLFSSARRHLGDMASKTYVAFVAPKRNFWLGLVCMILVVFITMQVGKFGMMIGILNAPSYGAAKTYLSVNNAGQNISTFPEGFQIVNDQAVFDIKVSDRYHRVLLQRVGPTWQVKESAQITEPLSSVHINFQ